MYGLPFDMVPGSDCILLRKLVFLDVLLALTSLPSSCGALRRRDPGGLRRLKQNARRVHISESGSISYTSSLFLPSIRTQPSPSWIAIASNSTAQTTRSFLPPLHPASRKATTQGGLPADVAFRLDLVAGMSVNLPRSHPTLTLPLAPVDISQRICGVVRMCRMRFYPF